MWRYDGRKLMVLALEGASYTEVNESVVLPPVAGVALTSFVEKSASTGRTAWLRSVREWTPERPD